MNIGHLLIAALALSWTGLATAAPTADTSGGVRSLSGGIGEDDQRAMRDAARDYSLGLTFSDTAGAFVADVDVRVKDRNGRVVYEGLARGPIVLVDLPSGNYTVEASYRGNTQSQKVTLAQGHSRALTMRWAPDRPAAPVAQR